MMSSTFFGSLMPGKTILVPGTFFFGSVSHSLRLASSQVMPDFFSASEKA